MKTNSLACSILCTLSIIIACILPSFSYADVPASLPIQSRAALKAHAIGAAKTGYTQLWGQKILSQDGDVTRFSVTGKNADDVIKQLTSPSNVFSTRTTDVNAPMYAYGSITDGDGQLLFWGNAGEQIKLVADTSGKMKITGGALTFRLAGQVPFEIEGAQSAQIQYEATDGSQWAEDVTVQNGKVFFPTNYAGTKSTLVIGIRTSAGYAQIAYSAQTGARNPGTSLEGTLASSLENHLTASDKGLAYGSPLVVTGRMTPPSDNQWGMVDSPTVTFTVTVGPGNERICTAVFQIKTSKEIKVTQAVAEHIFTDGTVEQRTATSVAVAYVGNDKVVTASWYLSNDEELANGSEWTGYLVIPSYEAQQPPQSPYSYGVTTTTKG